jgi:GNAT superfamily N-acetyltransferase
VSGYFNYNSQIAETRWDRASFVRNWWRIYAADARWAPPRYSLLRKLARGDDPFVARQNPLLCSLEAFPGRRRTSGAGMEFNQPAAIMDVPVAAAMILSDPRRQDGTAYLSLLRCVNDVESLERFVGVALEQAAYLGRYRLVGPTGLSPHLGSGVLQDYFHVMPPLHTAYNPPYVPEVTESVLAPLQTQRLYHAVVPAETCAAAGPAQIVRLALEEHRQELIRLIVETFVAGGEFPAPDEEEAAFLLRWSAAWPLMAWGAVVDGQLAGYVILQPDLAAAAARARGGKNVLWRLWLAWRSTRPVAAGRLLLGGVLPAYRGRGIGRQLWGQAIQGAHAAGWRTISAGPLADTHPAAGFLLACGAQARQSYTVYASEF